MGQVEAVEVADGKLAEDVVDHRGDHLDVVVADHAARRLEARVDEGIHVFFQGHAVLEAEGERDGEAVHDASGRPRPLCACR